MEIEYILGKEYDFILDNGETVTFILSSDIDDDLIFTPKYEKDREYYQLAGRRK